MPITHRVRHGFGDETYKQAEESEREHSFNKVQFELYLKYKLQLICIKKSHTQNYEVGTS